MLTVGIRELKAHLSDYVERVSRGERVVVTLRGSPVAVMSPLPRSGQEERVEEMLRDGTARWAGGKPRGASRSIRIRGAPLSTTVLEGRR